MNEKPCWQWNEMQQVGTDYANVAEVERYEQRMGEFRNLPAEDAAILDNYGAHKTPAVQRWFARHPQYHLHFTPTSASWLNMVERFFTEITEKHIRRGAFRSRY